MNPSEDPFSAVRLKPRNSEKDEDTSETKQNVQQEMEQPSFEEKFQEKRKSDPFYDVRIDSVKEYESEDDIDRSIERNIAGLTSRGMEQVLGFPGNVREFAKGVKELYHQDPIFSKLNKLDRKDQTKFEQESLPVIGAIGSIIDWFPTSSDLREKSKKMTKGYTEPTDEISKMGHEIFEDVISSTMPGTGQRNIIRNVAIPVLGVLAKKGSEFLGFEEKGQSLTKFGTTFLFNMMNNANGPRYNRQLWDNVQNNTPNVTVRPHENALLLRQARDLENQLTLGLGSRSENSALSAVRAFIEKLDRGQGNISARELVASNRSLNEIAGDPALLQRGRTLLNGLRRTIGEGIEYIGNSHPD